MGKVVPLGGNYAVAYAVKACDPDVITAVSYTHLTLPTN